MYMLLCLCGLFVEVVVHCVCVVVDGCDLVVDGVVVVVDYV